MHLTTCLKLLFVAVAVWLPGAALGQTYPIKPVRMILGFPPGSGVDIAMRVVAPRMGKALGQSIVIENRPGASTNLAAELVARAPGDGYTLLAVVAATAINQTLYPSLPYSLLRDFDAVAPITSLPNLLSVHPSLPVRSLKELVALARAHKGELSYSSNGSGSVPHLTMEMLKAASGMQLLHVPYRGTPQAMNDLMAGQVTMAFGNMLSVLPVAQSGRLRALAVTSARRSPVAPELPTIGETYAGFEANIWYAIAVPRNTPREIISRLNEVTTGVMRSPEVRGDFEKRGAEVLYGTPQETAAFLRVEVEKWGKAVKASGARVE
jgi:tripartite-type tricarboxylate transporter receptor subunit TctC